MTITNISMPVAKFNVLENKKRIDYFYNKCIDLCGNTPEGWGFGWADFCGTWNSSPLGHNYAFASFLDDEILSSIYKNVGLYADALGYVGSIIQDDSWLNVVQPMGFQESHTHFPATISGCLYLSDPCETGKFFIKNPNYCPFNSNFAEIPNRVYLDIKAGDVVLFPSHLEHGVEQNRSNVNRVSIAFNYRELSNDL